MIKKKLIIFAVIFGISQALSGQTWKRYFGIENHYDFITNISRSYDGGYIFGGTSYSYNEWSKNRIYKISYNGDTLWTKLVIGEVSIDYTYPKATNDGGFIICGMYRHDGRSKPYVAKFNPCAEKEWCIILDSYRPVPAATYITELSSGDFIISLLSFGNHELFESTYIVRLSQLGEVIWARPIIKHSDHPEAYIPNHDGILITANEDILISGRAYWKNPWDDRNLIRPTFALYDTDGNEKWVTPFGIADSLIGRGNFCIELNSGMFLCTGRHYSLVSNLQNGYLILLDSNGVVLNYRIVTPEDINGEWYSLFFDQLEVFDSSIVLNLSYLVSSTQGYPGIINIGNDIFEGDITVNAMELFPQMRYPHTLFRDTDDKLFYGTQYRLHAYDYDIYLRKMNSMLQVDSLGSDTYTYDSLCPYPITYSEIILDDCDLIDILSGVHEPQITHNNNLFRIIVSPNPVSDKMYLRYPDAHTMHGVHVRIFNSQGQVVENYNLGTKQETVHDIHHWPSGLYFIVAFNEGFSIGMSKFVKL